MKPYFGGSRTDASRAYLLKNTSDLTAYGLLLEQSKRDELNGIVLKSVELSETQEFLEERNEIDENNLTMLSWNQIDTNEPQR